MRKNPLCVACHQPATFASVLTRPTLEIKRNGKIRRGSEQVVTYFCNAHINDSERIAP